MNHGLSNRIRNLALEKYVRPALHAGKTQFSIRVRDLLSDLQAEGFPSGHTPQVCSALQTAKFLRDNGLAIEEVEGPPSRMSPTVVVRYRVAARDTAKVGSSRSDPVQPAAPAQNEDNAARAARFSNRLRGLLRQELKSYGGGEAFLRWIRSEDEDAA